MSELRDAIAHLWYEQVEETPSRNRDWHAEYQLSSRRLLIALVNELVERGVDRELIREGQLATLPGAYGPGRRAWDLTIVKDGIPIAAIVVVRQRGSHGNNLMNRISALTSAAFDVRRRYASTELAPFQPYLGLLYLLGDDPKLDAPRHRPNDEFSKGKDGSSIKEFLGDTIANFLSDGLYNGACLAISGTGDVISVQEPRRELSIATFVEAIAGRVHAHGQQTGTSSVEFGELLAGRSDLDDVLMGLTSTRQGMQAAEHAVIRRRRTVVANLRSLALAEETNETAMQKAIDGNYWIFGGQYVGVAIRRDLMNLHQHDIPLVSADRSLNIVELKGPESTLVKRHRDNHLVLSGAVHDAVGQCMNYLRNLDELGASLATLHRNDLNVDYDYRRARATVVIGHPERGVSGTATREQIDQTIRTYNAHLSRIHVMTYADLLDAAERALAFGEGARSDPDES
jgi:hypothetical protein